ncbi:hypothetical protein TanjilG_26352 [Lupinus angustifolius]|uniref:Uncharacterized protein n=1 Tax=Lupinus angustifolius TaxID=3871 RepID=A0A4P1R2S8_LUPAN|nr:PREDICTED: uncharacterized protein DDB_G0271670-like [Lupinus angustifolius]OIW00015.1 hypothetical protein TanjilG_26352 [Lupinus angustifolius]
MIETEGMKGGVGGRVGVGEDEMSDGMQCIDHPFRNNNNPGGICAICLQEKLAKLVSSSFPLPILPSTSSSSSPSFSSNNIASTSSSTIRPSPSITLATLTTPPPPPPPPPPPSSATSLVCPTNGTDSHHHQYCTRRTRIPFLLPKKKKKASPTSNNSNVVILKRSKSTATPSSRGNLYVDEDLTSHRKRNGFWSFLYHSSNSKSSSSAKKLKSKSFRDPTRISSTINVPNTSSSSSTTLKAKEKCKSEIVVVEDDNNSCNSNTTTVSAASSFERKVSRSRSVGCGSRSFSGDFFERISTGFGDCTLRRVESQREGKTKVNNAAAATTASGAAMNRERVRCGGLFSGFMMTSSSSSSSSSSSYWVSSSATENNNNNDIAMNNGKSVALSHGRAKNWGWAFASPMRAFTTKPSSSKENRRDIVRDAKNKNATPNLSAIPSLLSATG